MPAPRESPKSESIRSIARAFQTLRLMNTRPTWSLHELHLKTGLPKSTIFRILYTLQQEGYVRLEGGVGVYRLTEKVLEISDGYTEKSLLVEMGSIAALRLTKAIKWPASIGILDGDVVVIRYSGMPYSPIAAHPTTLGHRLGLANTAMGKTYLAFCPDAEREILFDMLRTDAAGNQLGDEKALMRDLAAIRKAGDTVRQPSQQRRTATMAAPILHDGGVAGLMGMTTFGRLMTKATIAQFAPLLKEAAQDIGELYTARLAQRRDQQQGLTAP